MDTQQVNMNMDTDNPGCATKGVNRPKTTFPKGPLLIPDKTRKVDNNRPAQDKGSFCSSNVLLFSGFSLVKIKSWQ